MVTFPLFFFYKVQRLIYVSENICEILSVNHRLCYKEYLNTTHAFLETNLVHAPVGTEGNCNLV